MNLNFFHIILVICLLNLLVQADDVRETHKTNQSMSGSYRMDANGKYIPETNADRFWQSGVWLQNTNGWRIILYSWNTNTPNLRISVAVGSRVVNSGGGYFGTPNGKFLKFELIDTNGTIVQPKEGASMEDQFPLKISDRYFPKWQDGGLKNLFGFFSNSPPAQLNEFRIRDVYQIKKEGDYILNVCAVIYRHETNSEYLNRIDLPCVTTKIHLIPSQ